MNTRAVLLALIASTAALSAYAGTATPRAVATVQALAGLAKSPQQKHFLDAKLRTGADGALSPGEPLDTELHSTRAAYITLVTVDAHGVAEVTQPDLGSAGNLLTPGTTVYFPAEGAVRPFAARLPAGPANVLVLATEKPIATLRGTALQPGAEPLVLGAEDAPAILSQLEKDIASGTQGEFQLATFPYQVKIGALSYSAEQIVQYFAETSRNTPHARLESWGVNFAFDSADVLPSSKAELDKWGRVLRDPLLANQRFLICGHTDDVGSEPYNKELSMKRAVSVRQLLITNYGISPERLTVEGFGSSEPLVQNESAEGRAMNRRVDFERTTTPAKN